MRNDAKTKPTLAMIFYLMALVQTLVAGTVIVFAVYYADFRDDIVVRFIDLINLDAMIAILSLSSYLFVANTIFVIYIYFNHREAFNNEPSNNYEFSSTPERVVARSYEEVNNIQTGNHQVKRNSNETVSF